MARGEKGIQSVTVSALGVVAGELRLAREVGDGYIFRNLPISTRITANNLNAGILKLAQDKYKLADSEITEAAEKLKIILADRSRKLQ